MMSYVFIASRGPWDVKEGNDVFGLALSLAQAGDSVAIYLTAEAVVAAHHHNVELWLRPLLDGRVKFLVDPIALDERGIEHESLARRLSIVPIEELCQLMAA